METASERRCTPIPTRTRRCTCCEGEILMHLDGAEERISAGGLVVAPRGLPHAFLVTADDTRVLCLQTPGCCQAFYYGASEPLHTRDRPRRGLRPDPGLRDAATAASRSSVRPRSRSLRRASPPGTATVARR